MDLTHATSIEVGAPASEVWRALVELADYGRWNRTIPRAAGDPLREGSRLMLWLELGTTRRAFRPLVVHVQPERLLVLEERLVHPALLRGTHGFRLEPLSDASSGTERVRLTQEWRLSGILAPFAWRKFREGFGAFARMNDDLAAEIEGRNAADGTFTGSRPPDSSRGGGGPRPG